MKEANVLEPIFFIMLIIFASSTIISGQKEKSTSDMQIKEILSETDHRPWKIPEKPWKFYQEWNRAIFLHWEVEIEALNKWVPDELEIDLINGKAWVSVVAFTMEKIRPRFLPAFSPISNFDEINIRTYVKYRGKPGVYFLSIEGGKSISCKIAKTISELPYRYSDMQRSDGQYSSRNPSKLDHFNVLYAIGEAQNEKEDIDKWLTERYALYQDGKNGINSFEIHHIEWPVKEVVLKEIDIKYDRFSSLLKGKPNKVQYSEGVQVIAWGKNEIN